MTDDGYEVGYGKPPRHTRFKPGVSRNPRGPSRRLKSIDSIFEQQLNQLVTVTRDGRKTRITLRELVVMNAVKAAANGDSRARELVFRHMRDNDKPDSFGIKPYDRKILMEFAATLTPLDDDDKSEA